MRKVQLFLDGLVGRYGVKHLKGNKVMSLNKMGEVKKELCCECIHKGRCYSSSDHIAFAVLVIFLSKVM